MKANQLKICVESECEEIYVPDREGKCPRCGSEGMWLTKVIKNEVSRV